MIATWLTVASRGMTSETSRSSMTTEATLLMSTEITLLMTSKATLLMSTERTGLAKSRLSEATRLTWFESLVSWAVRWRRLVER